ncbi:hypothetical protein M2444_000104 [Paenibacillus sp. PastF-3]|nr:hypothetical protein [Paenibacillus sp. PastF-3]
MKETNGNQISQFYNSIIVQVIAAVDLFGDEQQKEV